MDAARGLWRLPSVTCDQRIFGPLTLDEQGGPYDDLGVETLGNHERCAVENKAPHRGSPGRSGSNRANQESLQPDGDRSIDTRLPASNLDGRRASWSRMPPLVAGLATRCRPTRSGAPGAAPVRQPQRVAHHPHAAHRHRPAGDHPARPSAAAGVFEAPAFLSYAMAARAADSETDEQPDHAYRHLTVAATSPDRRWLGYADDSGFRRYVASHELDRAA